MYYVIEHDGVINSIIDTTGKPNKYGEPKLFATMADARKWILKKTYKGMTVSYSVKEWEGR